MKAFEKFEKLKQFLFATPEEMEEARLQEPEKARLVRLRDMYNLWLQNPRMADKQVLLELKKRYNVRDSVAYQDLRFIRAVLGDLNKTTQDFQRYVFLQRCEEGFQMARNENNAAAFAKVLATFGKYMRLDKDELNLPDYSQITPMTFQISGDPTVAGFTPIPNAEEKAQKLLQKFIGAKDTDFVEIKDLDQNEKA